MGGAISEKSVTYICFGRTRRIRTADLYHVKADWPHQDTLKGPKISDIARSGNDCILLIGGEFLGVLMPALECIDFAYRKN